MKIPPLTIEAVIQQMPGAAVLLNAQSEFLIGNQEFLNWSGFSSLEEMKGKTYCNMHCPASECHEEFLDYDRKVKNKPLSIFGYYAYNDDWRLVFAEKYSIKMGLQDDAYYHISHIRDISHNTHIFSFNQFINLKMLNDKFSLFNRQQAGFILEDTPIDSELSVREFECLFLLLRGKTSKEIARLLGISFRTVEFYLLQLKFKFQCNTRSQLIECAIAKGYLNAIPKSLL